MEVQYRSNVHIMALTWSFHCVFTSLHGLFNESLFLTTDLSNPSLCTPLTRTSDTGQEHRIGPSDWNTWQKPYTNKQKANGPYRSPKKPVQFNEHTWAKLCLYINLNWPSSSGGEDLQISWMYFCNFLIISKFKKLRPFHFRKLKSSFL